MRGDEPSARTDHPENRHSLWNLPVFGITRTPSPGILIIPGSAALTGNIGPTIAALVLLCVSFLLAIYLFPPTHRLSKIATPAVPVDLPER